jgi:hypothetical protein
MRFTSPVYSDAWGSIAGLTYSRNRTGMYTRARVTPVNPQSVFQQAVRGNQAELVAAWTADLTPAQRAAWDAYALAVPKVSHGISTNITGQNWYIACNTLRLQSNELVRVDDAPVILQQGIGPSVLNLVRNAATQNWDVQFETEDGWANEDDAALVVYASRGMNPSRNFFKGPYRFMGAIPGNSITPPTNPALFASPFTIVSGQKFFFYARVCYADARISVPFQDTATPA